MVNSSMSSMEGEVLEGFLCPICYIDLKTALNLNAHFQDQHQEDQKLFSLSKKSVKDIYEKAKKKIRGSDQIFSNSADAEAQGYARRTVGYPPSNPLESIPSRSHMDRFKAIRDLRNDRYSFQTNTLLIRLEKLMRHLPSDPIRRKAHEQEIVPWIDEKNVPLCPGCAKTFTLIKRKHHCRLCGAVMCKNCTFLLPLDTARKIAGVTAEASGSKAGFSSPATLTRLQPVQAVQSVLSLDGNAESEFRLCEHCHRLLEARETARQNRSEKPIVAQFYERLRLALDACEKAVKEYHAMYLSLCAGDTKFTLANAQELRIELLRHAEAVDSTSKKILVLGQNSDSPPTGPRLQLQQTIRNAAAQYLKHKVITLPSLPSEEEIAEYQERKRVEIERQIEAERKELEEEERKFAVEAKFEPAPIRKAVAMHTRSDDKPVTLEAGWTPTVKQAIISDDPVLQQIGILHGFIEQAERAGKVEECQALRQNLMELEQVLDEREKQQPNFESDNDEEQNDEKPVVVVLKEGDLTAEEAHELTQKEENQKADLSKRVIYQKPANSKRGGQESENRKSHKKSKSSSTNSAKSKTLLSFNDDEDE